MIVQREEPQHRDPQLACTLLATTTPAPHFWGTLHFLRALGVSRLPIPAPSRRWPSGSLRRHHLVSISNSPAAPKSAGTPVCGLSLCLWLAPKPSPGPLSPLIPLSPPKKLPLLPAAPPGHPRPSPGRAGLAPGPQSQCHTGAANGFHSPPRPRAPDLYMAFPHPTSRPSRETSGKLEKLPEGAPASPKKARDLPQTTPASAPSFCRQSAGPWVLLPCLSDAIAAPRSSVLGAPGPARLRSERASFDSVET